MNVYGIARLVRDVEIKQLAGSSTARGTCVGKFALAFDDSKKESHFIDADAWGKTAENISKYFQKGDKIFVRQATLKQDRWEKDGEKRSKHKITIYQWDFCGKKESADTSALPHQPEVKNVDLDDIPF